MTARRLAGLLVAFTTVLSSTALSASPVAATDPCVLHSAAPTTVPQSTTAPNPSPSAAPSGSPMPGSSLVPGVAPAPIVVPSSGGGHAPVGDPSVRLRAIPPAVVVPRVQTELPDERTARSRTFANPDGTLTTEIVQTKLNYRDAEGNWQPVDLGLVKELNDGFDLKVKANDVTVRLSDADADVRVAQLTIGTTPITLRALGYGAAAPRDADLNRLVFPGEVGVGAAFVQPADDGYEFGASLAAATDAGVYAFAVDTGNLSVVPNGDGSLLIVEPSGEGGAQVRGAVTVPRVSEAGVDEASVAPVSLQIVAPGDKVVPQGVPLDALKALAPTEVLLVYSIDPLWLADPLRKFPVTLDPTVCVGAQSGCYNGGTGAMDDFIFDYNPNSYPLGWTVVRVGYDNRTEPVAPQPYNRMRGMFYFPDDPLPDGAHVTSATMTTYVDQAFGSYSGKTINLYAINHGWGTNSTTWNDMTTPAQGWDNSPVSSFTVPGSLTAGTALAMDATPIVQEWYTRRAKGWHQNWGLLM
jgi:hypothetical protein